MLKVSSTIEIYAKAINNEHTHENLLPPNNGNTSILVFVCLFILFIRSNFNAVGHSHYSTKKLVKLHKTSNTKCETLEMDGKEKATITNYYVRDTVTYFFCIRSKSMHNAL